MTEVTRPFNEPNSRWGRWVFTFLAWMEKRIIENSVVGEGPFFDESQFPWIENLRHGWKNVLAEAEVVLFERDRLPAFQDISEDVGYITQDDKWKAFMLMGYGISSRNNMRRCPTTTRLLRGIPGVRTAFFSILEPGKRLPPHRGPYNGVLRLHLGLIVPQPIEWCWLRVGAERRIWQPGEVLIFDDSLQHEVHNNTEGVRVVLFVDFLRPCRWPIGWLNRFIVFAARFSPLVQSARRNQVYWEREFYGNGREQIGMQRDTRSDR